MTLPVIAVDPIAATAHVVKFNENFNAMAACAIYAIIPTRTVGLRFTVYGGVYRNAAGTPFVVGEQHVNLTPSTTNYIYADTTGVLGKATAAPTGWPGSNILGTALYTLVVGADSITSGTCWLSGRKGTGVAGAQGPTGESGLEFWNQRKRILQVIGDSANLSGGTIPGWDLTAVGSGGNIALGTSSFYDSVNKTRNMWRTTSNIFDVARGIDIAFRFGLDVSATFTPTDHRFFVGLYNVTPGTPSVSVETTTLVDLVGVGCDSTDIEVYAIHNDSSGTATKVALGSESPSSFPSKPSHMGGVGRIYDVRLVWEAGASEVSYTITDAASGGDTVSGVINTNLPSSSQLLGWMMWAGPSATFSTAMTCQVMELSRF